MKRFSSIILTAVHALLVAGIPGARAGSVSRAAPLSHAELVRYLRIHGYLPAHPRSYEREKQVSARIAAAMAARSAASRRAAAGEAASLLTGTQAPLAGPSWEGLSESDLAPPDPTGAVGPKSYIQIINDQVGIYARSGSKLGSVPLSLFTGSNGFLTDPQMIWDPATSRFFYVVLNASNNTMLWGFSKNANPQALPGDFCGYTADFGYGSALPDYPKLGQTADFLLIGVNVFGSSYAGSDVDWITKPKGKKPITTCPAASAFRVGKQSPLRNANGSIAFTPEPAVQTDPSGTGWIVATAQVSGTSGASFITVFEVTRKADGTADIEGTGHAVPVPSYMSPPPAPQPGGHPLDTLDGRFMHAVSAKDPSHGGKLAVWTAHSVMGGAGAEERWYEIDPSTSTVLQSGVANDLTLFVFNGGISPDRKVAGTVKKFGADMVMGVSTSSAASFPAVQMVSKVGIGGQSGLVLVKQSPGSDEGFDCFQLGTCRWGDYSGAAPDPGADPHAPTGRVWLSNMWASGAVSPLVATWRTWNWEATP